MAIFPGSAIPSAVSDYEIDNSLRFRDSSPYTYLQLASSGTPTSTTTGTLSFWLKRSKLGDYQTIWYGGPDTSNYTSLYIHTADVDTLVGYEAIAASTTIMTANDNKLVDPSAWYHIVWTLDTTESVEVNRSKLYINNELVTPNGAYNYPAEDGVIQAFRSGSVMDIGRQEDNTSQSIDGYLAEFRYIDGQALTPSSFAETSTTTNQWMPIEYDGTYGNNGFYQKYGGTDPYGSATDLLLHMDGSDSGTTFTDATGNHTITRDGVTTTTSDKKFGTASANFNGGTEDNDLIVDHTSGLDFDGDFTIDFWTKVATAAPVLNNRFFQKGSNSATGVTMAMDADNIYFGRSDEVLVSFDRDLVLATGNWHHIAVTRASDNYFRIFLDGVLKDTSSSTYADNLDNSGGLYIGAYPGDSTGDRFDGLIDEFRVAKGIARWTTNFSVPTEAYSSLGLDSSGNGNNFTVTNLAATDQMIDTPTNNFCTLNPVTKMQNASSTLTEGNLQATTTAANWNGRMGTMGVSSGKWYWEIYQKTMPTNNIAMCGIVGDSDDQAWAGNSDPQGGDESIAIYGFDGNKYIDGSDSGGYGVSYTAGDIIGVALNMTDSELTFYKNNTAMNSGTAISFSGGIATANSISPLLAGYGATGVMVANFGQDSSFAGNKTAQGNQDSNEKGDFYYTPPTDYLALCSDNLSDPEIAKPDQHFNTILWSGTGGDRDFTGVGFQPDFSWIKERDGTAYHSLFDSVRGVTTASTSTVLSSNVAHAQPSDNQGHIKTFDSDGFSLRDGTSGSNPLTAVNKSSQTYVGWNWKAGGTPTATNSAGAGATPTAGSVKIAGSNLGSALAGTIPATRLSANTTNGFSIIEYTGTGEEAPAGQTVAHGLSVTPKLLIFKVRDSSTIWYVNDTDVSETSTRHLQLEDTSSLGGAYSGYWNSADPTASIINLGPYSNLNSSGSNMIWCFHSVEGYSKVGTYVGNSTTDGPFIYTGFRIGFLMVKLITASSGYWVMFDNKRDPDNPTDRVFYANEASITTDVSSYTPYDLLSNGFKSRIPGGDGNEASYNSSGETYIYLAFAESPFKYSNAR